MSLVIEHAVYVTCALLLAVTLVFCGGCCAAPNGYNNTPVYGNGQPLNGGYYAPPQFSPPVTGNTISSVNPLGFQPGTNVGLPNGIVTNNSPVGATAAGSSTLANLSPGGAVLPPGVIPPGYAAPFPPYGAAPQAYANAGYGGSVSPYSSPQGVPLYSMAPNSKPLLFGR